MRKLPLLLLFVIASFCTYSQKLDLIHMTGYGANYSLYVLTQDKVYLVLSKDGNLVEYGTEYPKEFYGSYPGKLQKYMGRVDYYGQTDNEAFRGKVKYIGLNLITYYGSYDEAGLAGKVKSIGTLNIDYYSAYEDAAIKGMVKNLGTLSFSYFSSFENEAIRGRLKNIGVTKFTWYTSFDDKALSGKVKSIDMHNFSYYTSFETTYSKGTLKSGFQTKYINGINYYLRN